MKWLWFIFFAINSLNAKVISHHSSSIYGVDNRRLVTFVNDDEYQTAQAVAAQVSLQFLSLKNETTSLYQYQSVGEVLNFCANERFYKLPMLGDCSGFLVGKDLLLTAGHCMKTEEDCKKKVWIFNYEETTQLYSSKNNLEFNNSQIYNCKSVVTTKSENNSKGVLDYALVKLDRPVLNIRPLKLQLLKKVSPLTTKMKIIGHPLGMPKMFTEEFTIRDNTKENSFVINSDTFSGNSGSPVIDVKSNQVVGMLVNGETDLEYDVFEGCNHNKKCSEEGCLGETAVRASSFPLKYISLQF